MKKIIINNAHIIQKSGKNHVIFSLSNSELYTLNETASLILSYIKKGFDEERMISQIQKLYNADTEEVKQDVKDLLELFTEKGIISYQRK